MITSEQQPLFTQNDPLAIQFLSRGGMGYMPQAQFLTPSEYGAFRTMPAARSNDFLNQDPGLFQSYLIRSRGALMGLPEYTFNTYNPVANQQLYMSQIRRSSYDQMAAMGASGASLAASLAMTAPFGFFPGLALGMVMPDMAAPFVNRVRDTRAMQNATMSRIVGGPDMNAVTGMGFNAAAAHDISRSMRLSAAEDVLFKQGDYQKLMQLGIEHGLFDYGSSASQYKDTLKKLRNSMTTFMEVVGSTDFKDIMKDMKRLQTMGASAGQFMGISRAENMYARMAGLNHADMVNTYGQQGALIYAQAGLNNYQGSLQAMSNAAAVTMAQRMGILKPSEIARFGGVSGMAQTLTQQDAQANTRVRDYLLSYLVNDSMTGLDENVDLMDLMTSPNPLQRMASRAGRTNDPSKMATFQANAAQLYGQAVDKYGQDNIIGVVAHAMGRSANIEDPRMAMQVGMQMLGYSPEMAQQKSTMMFNEDFQAQRQREARIHRQKMYEEHSLAQNPFRRFGRWIDTSITKVFENTFGEAARSYTNWQEKRDAEASGMIRDGGPVIKYDNLAEKLALSADVNKNREADGVWTGTIKDVAEWRDRVGGGLLGEHGGKGMGTVSYRVGADGRVNISRTDRGGSSFGEAQLTTENTLAFIRGNENLKEQFRKSGFDVDADAEKVMRTRAAIASGRQELAQKEDWEALSRLQKAWGDVHKTEGFDNEYFTFARDLNWNNAFMKSDANDLFKNDEAWRRVLFPIANHRGGAGAAAMLNRLFKDKDVNELNKTEAGRRYMLDTIYNEMATINDGQFKKRYARGGQQYIHALSQLENLAPENQNRSTYQQRLTEAARKEAASMEAHIIRKMGKGTYEQGLELDQALHAAKSKGYDSEQALSSLSERMKDFRLSEGTMRDMLSEADVSTADDTYEVSRALVQSLTAHMVRSGVAEHEAEARAKITKAFNNDPNLLRDLMAAKYATTTDEQRKAMDSTASAFSTKVETVKNAVRTKHAEYHNDKFDDIVLSELTDAEAEEFRNITNRDPDRLLKVSRLQEMLRGSGRITDKEDREEFNKSIREAALSVGFTEEGVQRLIQQQNMRAEDLKHLGLKEEDAQKLIDLGTAMYERGGKSQSAILGREEELKRWTYGAGDNWGERFLKEQLNIRMTEQRQVLSKYKVDDFSELRKKEVLERVSKAIEESGTQEEKAWIKAVRGGADELMSSTHLTPLRDGAAADSRSGAVAGTNEFEAMWSAMAKANTPAGSSTTDAALKELPGVLTNLNTTLTNMDSTLKRLDKKAPSTSEKTVWNPFGG